jgi:hypothetical protein
MRAVNYFCRAGGRFDCRRANAARGTIIGLCLDRPALDASSSMDTDGDMLSSVFEWNDGGEATMSPDPVTLHTFIRETLVTVVVEVLDIRNATARAEQDVSIRADYPDPPDFCDGSRPCVVGDECVEGVCSFNGAGID